MFFSDFAGLARIATAAVTLLTSSAAAAAQFQPDTPAPFVQEVTGTLLSIQRIAPKTRLLPPRARIDLKLVHVQGLPAQWLLIPNSSNLGVPFFAELIHQAGR